MSNYCKYYIEKEMISYDGGLTWQDTGNERKGNLYEYESEDCTFPSYLKFRASYIGDQTYEKECDDNTALTTGDTKPSGYEFSGMTSAVIGNCVTSIDNAAFFNCGNLTSINIPNSVTIIGIQAFYQCTSLTSITIPSSVTSIGGSAFRDCSSLTEITIPNSVTSIGNYTFRYCTGLASIRVEATTPPTLGGNAFQSTNDCPIYVPASSVEAYKSASGWSTYASRIQAIP